MLTKQVALNLDAAHMDSSKTFTLSMFGKDVELSLYLISILLPGLDLLGILAFLGFVLNLRFAQQRQKLAIDKKTKTAADYSIMVTGIVGNGLDIEAVRAHFEFYGKVEAVSVASYNEVFLTCKRKSAEINEKLAIVQAKVAKAQQVAREKGKTPPLFWVSDGELGAQGMGAEVCQERRILTTRKTVHMPLVYEMENNRKALDKLRVDLEKLGAQCDDMYAAFITFENEQGRRKCLDSVSLRDYIPYIGNSSRGKQMKSAIIQEAPEVTNVSWENLQYGLANRTLRTGVIVLVALVLLAGSFALILIAQVYQRYHPLQSCPPAVLESRVDTVSQDYFSNKARDAWGPGMRGTGLSPLLSDGLAFDKFGVCQGGGRSGQKCDADGDCISVEGSGICQKYDLSCSYRAQMERADREKEIKGLSQAERAELLNDEFVEEDQEGGKQEVVDAEQEEGKREILKWDQLGLPPMCMQDLYVLDEAVTVREDSVEQPQRNYTYDRANYTRDHTESGQLTRAACLSNMPSIGEPCVAPPDNCTRWPGCNYSAWPSCQEPTNDKTRCVEVLTIAAYKVENATAGTFKWEMETLTSPSHEQAARCSSDMLSAGNVSCQAKLKVVYETEMRVFNAVPVYSEWVCERYKEQCSSCFCIDTIANFWVVWFFSLSPGYSALCSKQFQNIVEEYSLFVGAAVSVTGVNMLLKMLLRSFAGFEKSYTKSDTEKSIAVKIFIAQFFNTALVPLLVYARVESLSETVCRGGTGVFDPANPDETFGFNGMPCKLTEKAFNTISQTREPVCSFGGGECRSVVPDSFPIFRGEFTDFQSLWYSTVGTSILITVLVNMVLTLLPVLVEWPVQVVSEKMAASTCVTQRQLNRVFEGPDFELAARYGVILNNIFSCMLYSAGSPV